MLSISKVIFFAILYQFHLKQPKTEFLDLFVKKRIHQSTSGAILDQKFWVGTSRHRSVLSGLSSRIQLLKLFSHQSHQKIYK
jgi:hypothetical protein